jgi:hypothetical protein
MAKFDKKVEGKEEKKPTTQKYCAMPGCPLVGSMSDSNRGGGLFWCSFHFDQRDPRMYTPEELAEHNRIAPLYNKGKRDYGAQRLETRGEMHERVLSERLQKIQQERRKKAREAQERMLSQMEDPGAAESADMAFHDTREGLG